MKLSLIILFLLCIACGENHRLIQENSPKQNFILGNKVTSDDTYASVVHLLFKKGVSTSACSGTLICRGSRKCNKSSLIKTSAHCFLNDDTFERWAPEIIQELKVSGSIVETPNQFYILDRAIDQTVKRIFLRKVRGSKNHLKIRIYKNKKIKEKEVQSVSVSPYWLSHYSSLFTALLKGDEVAVKILADQYDVLSSNDQAYINLKKQVDDIPIYRTTTPEQVQEYLTEGESIKIAGWGLSKKNFNFGVTAWGVNDRSLEKSVRLETDVKVRKGLSELGFFLVGEFTNWWLIGMRVFQNGACMGDSGGGAFMRINGEIRHIGTITAIQSGLCGSNAATDLNGKSISPSNSFHTTVLSW